MAHEQLRTVPVRQSLLRPILLFGGERELVLGSALISTLLIAGVMTWLAVVAGVLFWLAMLWVLTRMAKADPLFSRVYLRHIRYQAYYPAQSWYTVRE